MHTLSYPFNAHHYIYCLPIPFVAHPDISKVTRLERDASSGTALQEISFWMNLEHALDKIHLRRHSPEVQLTLDLLKAGKRFHATVSFDADTGEYSTMLYTHCRENAHILVYMSCITIIYPIVHIDFLCLCRSERSSR